MVGDPKDARSPQDLFEAWYLNSGAGAHGLKPTVEMARHVWHKMLPPRASAMTTKWCRSYWDRQCTANLAARHGRTYMAANRARKTDDGKCVSLVDVVRQISGSDRTTVTRAIAALESAGWCFARKRAESSRRERVVDIDLLGALVSALATILPGEPERASVAAYWGSTAHAALLVGRQENNTTTSDAGHAAPAQTTTPYGLDMRLFASTPAAIAPVLAANIHATKAIRPYVAPETSPALPYGRPALPTIMPYDSSLRASRDSTHGTTLQCAVVHADSPPPTAPQRLEPAQAQPTPTSGGSNSDNPIWLDGGGDGAGTLFDDGAASAIELDLNDPPPSHDQEGNDESGSDHIKVEVKEETDEPSDSTKRKWTYRDGGGDDDNDEGTETEDEEGGARTDGQSGPPSPIEIDYPPTKPSDLLGLCPKRRRTTGDRMAKGRDNHVVSDDSKGRWHVWRNV